MSGNSEEAGNGEGDIDYEELDIEPEA